MMTLMKKIKIMIKRQEEKKTKMKRNKMEKDDQTFRKLSPLKSKTDKLENAS